MSIASSHGSSVDWTGYGPPSPSDAIRDGLSRLRLDQASSDFAFVAHGQEWKVHKLVLSMHSDVLYKMSSNGEFPDSRAGRTTLHGLEDKPFDAHYVQALVMYMYEQRLVTPWTRKSVFFGQAKCHGWSETRAREDAETAVLNQGADLPASNADSAVPPDDGEEKPKEPVIHGDCVYHPTEGLDFLITMANMAQMYNIPALKYMAEQVVDEYQDCLMPGKLDAVVERICTAGTVTERMRKLVVNATASKLGRFHKTGTLDDHPEFKERVFQKLGRDDHRRIEREKKAEVAREAATRRRNSVESTWPTRVW